MHVDSSVSKGVGDMARRGTDLFSEAVVGVFMLAVLSLLAYFTIVISGIDVIKGRETTYFDVAFDAVGGLKAHDNVMYRGTKVGRVEEIFVTPSNLVVHVEIDRGVVLREKYRVAVCSLSMLGGNFLQLEEGTGEPIELKNAMLAGETPSDWMQDLAKVARNLNEITSRAEISSVMTNVEAVTAAVRRLVDRVERGEGTIGKLFDSDETVYNDIRATVSNAVVVSANAVDISEKVKATTFLDDLEGGAKAFRTAGESLDLKSTVKRADDLLDNLNEVALRLKNGEGTLGRLTADSALYDEIQGLIKDVRQVLDNYRDTTPISTFGSLIMGGL